MKTYTIAADCSNCGKRVPLTIPKGETANGARECPNCGCQTAVKAVMPQRTPLLESLTWPPQKTIEPPRLPFRQFTLSCGSSS